MEIDMTEEELARFTKFAREFTANLIKTEGAALALLVKEGIYDEDGNLTPEFGGEERKDENS